MKKVLIISLLTFFILIFVLVLAAVYFSFKIVKPTTQDINSKLEKYFANLIYIPKGIPRPSVDLSQTTYYWEMETRDKEVIGVTFNYNPAFTAKEHIINANLSMPQNGDASIFTKVLPAVIADKQSLDSALDPKKANLSANNQVGYEKIDLQVKPDTEQSVKISWEFNKNNLPKELKDDYTKLEKIPVPLLGILYGIPHFLISLASGS